jgi:hypothetical protein
VPELGIGSEMLVDGVVDPVHWFRIEEVVQYEVAVTLELGNRLFEVHH